MITCDPTSSVYGGTCSHLHSTTASTQVNNTNVVSLACPFPRGPATSTISVASAPSSRELNGCSHDCELGVQAPAGIWEPLGLLSGGGVTVFQRRRETEIKHGRGRAGNQSGAFSGEMGMNEFWQLARGGWERDWPEVSHDRIALHFGTLVASSSHIFLVEAQMGLPAKLSDVVAVLGDLDKTTWHETDEVKRKVEASIGYTIDASTFSRMLDRLMLKGYISCDQVSGRIKPTAS